VGLVVAVGTNTAAPFLPLFPWLSRSPFPTGEGLF
jgi:hypothetical protein